jgi:hypothetical protein
MSASPSCRQRKLIPLSQVGQYLGWRIESETGLGSIFSGDLDLGYRTQRDKGLSWNVLGPEARLRRCDALGDQVTAVLDVDDATIDGEVIAAAETGRITSTLLERRDETVALGARPLRIGSERRGATAWIFLLGIKCYDMCHDYHQSI